MPECVFRIEFTVREYRIFDVLERVFALELHVIEFKVYRTHESIFTLNGGILHNDPVYGPAEFGRYNVAAAYPGIRALPQCLDPVHLRARDLNVVRIPYRGTAERGHLTAFDPETVIVPKRISEIEIAISRGYPAALFERALAVGRTVKAAVYRLYIITPVQGTLFIKCLIFDRLHVRSFSFDRYFSII